jgi:hypothetical protein
MGTSRAYLVHYTPNDLVNWCRSDAGEFEWIVLRTTHTYRRSLGDAHNTTETRWLYYDRQHFRVYRRTQQQGSVNQQNNVELIDEGVHGLAKLNRVPLLKPP